MKIVKATSVSGPMENPRIEPFRHDHTGMTFTCHELGCSNQAEFLVTFKYYQEYRCGDHLP